MNILPVFFGYQNRLLPFTLILALGGLLSELTGCTRVPATTGQIADGTLATTQPAAQLINQLRAIVPASPKSCDSHSPWHGGVFVLPNQGLLNPGECFGIELSLLKKK